MRSTTLGILIAVTVVPASSLAENLVRNPSVEEIGATGKPLGWGHYENTADQWGATDKEFFMGRCCAFLKITGFDDAPFGPLPGQVVIDADHPQWLKRQGGKHLFICGPGDPEDFLYLGKRRFDGTRDGDQVQRLQKLIEHGGNCVYLQIVRTHGGDAGPDRTQNPFVDSDPAQGLDEDILNQWEEWFTLMDHHEILIYLFFYDDGARIWNTGDRVGPEEKAFLETIVKRFQHQKNLIWIVGEESEERYSTARVQAIAEVIRRADDHGHLVGDHHLSGTTFKAWRPGGALNHFSMQLSAMDDAAHAGALDAWHKNAGRYQVIYAESTAMRSDKDGMRRHAWAVAMGGLMPMLLRMDIANTPIESLQQCRYLQRFFEATDFYRLAPHDELRHAETQYVLGDPGRSYIAYADSQARKVGVKGLPAGRCDITWLDCQTGRTANEQHTLTRTGDHAFDKPPTFGPECAAWIRFPDLKSSSSSGIAPAPEPTKPPSRNNQRPTVEHQRCNTRPGAKLYVQLKFVDDDGPGPYCCTIVSNPPHGTLSGDNNDRYYTPNVGFTGTDQFTWKVNDGVTESQIATVAITVSAAEDSAPEWARYVPPPESQGGWRKLDQPEDIRRVAGADPAKLDELKQWLLQSDKRTFAAVVIRRGYLVLEVERGNSAKTDSRRVASVSKAICATVLAIASEQSQQGKTPRRMTFDNLAFDFIPWAHPLSDPRKARITVKQLFNHTSGICPEATGAPNDGTWDYILGHSGDERTAKLAFDPGTACGYSTHAFEHAALVCETVTGKPYDQFTIEALFKPLGIEHWWFQKREARGEKFGRHPSQHMGMPARDLARIAYCTLRGGRWGERQVIPQWFVAETAAPTHNVKSPEMRWGLDAQTFSHGWQLPARLTGEGVAGGHGIPPEARYKPGSGGQLIAFVPSLDLVVARQTGSSGQWQFEEYLRRACAAVMPEE